MDNSEDEKDATQNVDSNTQEELSSAQNDDSSIKVGDSGQNIASDRKEEEDFTQVSELDDGDTSGELQTGKAVERSGEVEQSTEALPEQSESDKEAVIPLLEVSDTPSEPLGVSGTRPEPPPPAQFSFSHLRLGDEEFEKFLKPAVLPQTNEESAKEELEVEQLLYDLITRDGASIFVRSDSAVCEQAINILKSFNLKFYLVRLDEIERGDEMHAVLEKCCGKSELPLIFINAQLIGGYEDLWHLFYTELINYVSDGQHTPYITNFSFTYQMVVIGGGSPGVVAALEAGKLGKRVALVDYAAEGEGLTQEFGGRDVEALYLLHSATSIAFNMSRENVCWCELMGNVHDEMGRRRFAERRQLKAAGVELFSARAAFRSPHVLELTFPKTKEKKLITSSVFVIATGSSPKIPSYIQGLKEYCITADCLFRRRSEPGKTLVLAATHFGLECATILANLKREVTVLAMPGLCEEMDEDIFRRLRSHLEERNVDFLEKVQLEKIDRLESNNTLKVFGFREGACQYEMIFHTVLLECGWVPNTAHLGLSKLGIKVDSKSRKILVDSESRTSRKHIFALGDVAHDSPHIPSLARRCGKFLIERIYKGVLKYGSGELSPVRFLLPVEYCRLGLSEGEATAKYGKRVCRVYSVDSRVSQAACNPGSSLSGTVYLKALCRITEHDDEEVIGVHLVCDRAVEIMQGIAVSLRNGLTKDELFDVLLLHPLLSEVVFKLNLQPFRSLEDITTAYEEKLKEKEVLKAMEVSARHRRLARPLKQVAFPLERGPSAEGLHSMSCRNPKVSESMRRLIMGEGDWGGSDRDLSSLTSDPSDSTEEEESTCNSEEENESNEDDKEENEINEDGDKKTTKGK